MRSSSNYREDRNRPGSSGVVLDGYECRLTDADAGNVVEGAGRGHLHVRGGSAIPYYLNKPEKTAESIRDGWVRTGDVYRRDGEGFFWFEGREDDLSSALEMWVSAEVEDALAQHAAVMEAAVIAEADDTGATIPAAYVLLRAGNEPEELRTEIIAKAAESLPRFKQPKRIHFMDQLPRTPTGKVQRQAARAGAIQAGFLKISWKAPPVLCASASSPRGARVRTCSGARPGGAWRFSWSISLRTSSTNAERAQVRAPGRSARRPMAPSSPSRRCAAPGSIPRRRRRRSRSTSCSM